MTTTLRGQRPEAPAMPSGEIRLQAPPELDRSEGAAGVMMNAIPMLGSLGSIVLVVSMGAGAGGGGGRSYLAAGMFLVATLGFVVVQIDRQRKQRAQSVTGSRTDYLRYLGTVRTVAREAAAQQRRALTWQHPDPASLPALAEERSRVWERGPTDPTFLHARYGVCSQELALRLVPPDSAPFDKVDPAAAAALHRLLVVHRTQPDLPASIDLRAFDRVEVCGADAPARALARALVCSAAAFHSPEHLVVAVLAGQRQLVHWDWVKWLPHAHSRQESDAVGPRRMVSTSLEELADLLPPDLSDRPRFGADERPAAPHVMLVLDGADLPPGNHVVPPDGLHGVTVLDLPSRWADLEDATRLRLALLGPEPGDGYAALEGVRVRESPVGARGDQCDLATAEAFARRLTALHTVTAGAGEGGPSTAVAGPSDFMALLGLGDVHDLDPDTTWRTRPARDRLRVPIGSGDGGGPVHLDLKESAQQGMGPHGLVIGATGSGKSEFLRTLVLGLAVTHSPEHLNMVLVDFKGGATFSGMSEMPHVSAVITNLSQELTLVDRMQDALAGEMVRRQELLRAAGNFASIRDYERARAAGEALEPMPSLFIVVDEFSEMLSAKPEFIDLFVAIGRLGRSLGLHLLLASQRLEEGRLRGLESHLSYRVGLRTFSAHESRAVLGVPDAYELPAVPGLGYLKPDPTSMQRFKAAYVSGPPAARSTVPRDEGGQVRGILPFTVSVVQTHEPEPEPGLRPRSGPAAPTPADHGGSQPSLLDLAVRRMSGHGPAAHRVWLPPLDVPDSLDGLFGDLVEHPELGLVSPSWRELGGLTVPLGTVDRPREQRRETLSVDLSGAAGHVAIVGGPRTGKSTLLRTIISSASMVTTPLESQVFVLDFGGGAFAPMAGYPHVAGIGTRSEPDVVRRIIAEVTGIVDLREAYFRSHGIDSIETYRARRRQGRADDGYGDVFLVVDGWSTLRADFDDLELEIQQLAGRGLTFGLHVVAGAARWADFRAAMRDVFGTRLELRLGDPIDSEIDRKLAALVPTGRPGRGLVQAKLHFLGALPRIDGSRQAETLGEGVESMVARVTAAWRGPTGPKLRLLPDSVALDDVRRSAGVTDDPAGGRLLLLGVNERELAPVGLDPDSEPHLLVLGDGQSGKSALLRTYLREVTRTRSPQQAQVILVDYRRSLLGEVPEEYLLNYLTSAQQATPALQDVAAYLEQRIPGPDVTPDQLRNRSWWQGAEVFLVADDYDLIATQQSSPVAVLQPLLAQARDVGLHLVLARRSGGASRALYEPVIQSLRDLAMPGLLLSGSPEEGPLIGNLRPVPLRPGRGRLVTRDRGVEVVQTAWTEPTM